MSDSSTAGLHVGGNVVKKSEAAQLHRDLASLITSASRPRGQGGSIFAYLNLSHVLI